jgi:hypothetical protein
MTRNLRSTRRACSAALGSAVSIVVVALLAFGQTHTAAGQAMARAGATTERTSSQSAVMSFEDGDRNAFVQVTRDHSAGVTWLFFGYSFLDPEDPNQLILVSGDGEIPASSLDVSSGSARLVLTTPDSYPVTRCVIDNTTGEYTCEVSGPSRLALIWTADGHGSVETQARTVEQSGTVMWNGRVRFEEVTARVAGAWDGQSSPNLAGYLIESENATLFRERAMRARRLSRAVTTSRQHAEAYAAERQSRMNARFAFADLGTDDGLNGFVEVMRDETTQATRLRFGYAFPDPADPSRVLFFTGRGDIPNDGFAISAASARLAVSTPTSVPVTRCVITGVVGEPGAITCAPWAAPVTFDIAWTTDGEYTLHEAGMTLETLDGATTALHRQANLASAATGGMCRDEVAHEVTGFGGRLSNVHSATMAR